MSGIRAFFRVLSRAPRARKRNFVLAQVGIVIMVIAQLMIPQLIRQIIDEGVLAEDLDAVVTTSFWMIAWSVISLVVSGVVAYLAASTATSLAHAVRSNLYESISQLSYGNLDRLSTSSLLVRITSDVNIMRNSFMMTTYMLFQAPWLLLGAFALVALQIPELLWIMAVVFVVVSGFVLAVAPSLGPLYATAQRQLDRLSVIFGENISGVRVVKAFNRDALESERFEEQNERLYDAQIRPAFRAATFQPVLFGLLYLAIGVAVMVVGPDIATGVNAGDPNVITPGELTTFFNYLLTALIPIMIVAFVLPELGKFEASLARAVEVFETVPDVVESDNAIDPGVIEGRIEFRDVAMAYLDEDAKPGSNPVLRDVNLTIEPGETVAILGQTGAGKTTLINLIGRFYDVTSGAVLVDGIDVRELDLVRLRQQVSIAPQQATLFSGTFAENLRYGNPDASHADICRAADIADAHEFISAQVGGYEGMVAEQGKNLSGGQRQRLSLARAITADPRILILDDTTSAVDVATEARIQDRLEGEMAGHTVVIVAQRISTAIGADKIVLLGGGSVLATGTHAELMATSPEYVEIFESQLGSAEEAAELMAQ